MTWKTMTYGEMPSRRTFRAHWERVVPTTGFSFRLNASDGRCMEAAAPSWSGDGVYEEAEVWALVQELIEAFHRGSDCAGDLASSIMYALEFEWI